MATEFLLPKLAESVVEGEIVQWLVTEGERVEVDQPLVEVMSDKATVELPSTVSGTVTSLLAAEGDVVEVGAVLALIDSAADGPVEGADTPATEAAAEAAEDDAAAANLFRPTEAAEQAETIRVRRPEPTAGRTAAVSRAPTGPYGRVLAVPAARKLARELGIDIEQLHGSGPHGRVRVHDVHAQHGAGAGAASGLPPEVPYRTPDGYADRERREKLRGIRRLTSRQMVASHLHTVRALHVDEADVSNLVRLRRQLKPHVEEEGARLSYLPFIMKATVAALKRFPELNTSLDAETEEIVWKDYWNISMAVSTDAGLVVPVIRDVDRLSLAELAGQVQELAGRAREGRLTGDDLQGGTFSITNIGSVGGLFSFPIINVPEAAILGVHSIRRRPKVLEDDSIVPADMLYLSLSFDHRLVDGAEAASFMNLLTALLEEPERLLLEMR